MRRLWSRRCGQATRSWAALAVALAALVWIPSASALSVMAIAPANNAHITFGEEFVFTWKGDVKGCLKGDPGGVHVENNHGAGFAVGFILASGRYPGGRAVTASGVARLFADHGILRWRLHATCSTANGDNLETYSGYRTLYFDQPGTKPKECTATAGGLTGGDVTEDGKPLHPGDSVSQLSTVVVGAGGLLSLLFPDGTDITLGPGSNITMWKLHCKSSDGGDEVRLKFGKLRRVAVPTVTVKVGKAVRVRTANASVKPTLAKRKMQSVAVSSLQEAAFQVSYDPSLRTTREHTFAEAALVQNNAGKVVTVPAGFCSSVVGGAAPTTPRRC